MATTAVLYKDFTFGGKPAKIYKVTASTTDTSTTITPGTGFTKLMGNHGKYTISSGEWTITHPTQAANSLQFYMFIAP